mgnify:CR=1 FL=1
MSQIARTPKQLGATIFDLLAALDLEIEIKPRSKGSAADIEDVF